MRLREAGQKRCTRSLIRFILINSDPVSYDLSHVIPGWYFLIYCDYLELVKRLFYFHYRPQFTCSSHHPTKLLMQLPCIIDKKGRILYSYNPLLQTNNNESNIRYISLLPLPHLVAPLLRRMVRLFLNYCLGLVVTRRYAPVGNHHLRYPMLVAGKLANLAWGM